MMQYCVRSKNTFGPPSYCWPMYVVTGSRYVSGLPRLGVESGRRWRFWHSIDERLTLPWLTVDDVNSTRMAELPPSVTFAHLSHLSHPHQRRYAGRSTSKWISAPAYRQEITHGDAKTRATTDRKQCEQKYSVS